MAQSNLWQIHTDTGNFAELCAALYQREVSFIAKGNFSNAKAVQERLASLPYYISRTAHAMTEVVAQGHTPLQLDYQNASWSVKQSRKLPSLDKETNLEREKINHWYLKTTIKIGLVVPVLLTDRIILDCIDRIDLDKKRIRTNLMGWFSLSFDENSAMNLNKRLLKPNKKIMSSACTGQCWQGNTKLRPIMPSLRELLLSCSINWADFKKPLVI